MAARPTPFDLVFADLSSDRFPAVRASLEATGADPHDLDAFVLDREAAQLLRDLVPEGVGEAVAQHLALLHHAYLFWHEGSRSFRLARSGIDAVLAERGLADDSSAVAAPRAYYIQFPERLWWAEVAKGEPHEPLDGLFVRPWPGSGAGFFVLGVFGLHPGRAGFSVVDIEGYRPQQLERADAAPLFASVLPGGIAAGLRSLVGEEEMLELAARTVPVVARATLRGAPGEVIEIA